MKQTVANSMPSTRWYASACELTSIATVPTDASRMRASSACTSGASGVVSCNGSATPAMRTPVVPMMPAGSPAARAIASTRYVVVVLPLVPVTPRTRRPRAGSP